MARSLLVLGTWLASRAAADGTFPVITPAPVPVVHNVLNAATTDVGYSACLDAASAIESCSSAIGDLNYLPASQVAQCLCCVGKSWSPDAFDGSAETCASWIHTELPQSTTQYVVYSALGDYCESEGNVCSSATRTRSASSSLITTAPAACTSLLDIASECALSSTGILTAPIKSQAGCYCYMSTGTMTTWVPSLFDGYASECADWASTADTMDYSGYSALATFCHSVGNFLATATGTTSVITRTSGSTPTAAGTGQSSGSTTSKATAVTVTVEPSPTSTNAAGGAYGRDSVALGLGSIVMALFSYFL